jgi:PRTRC genetic system protein A
MPEKALTVLTLPPDGPSLPPVFRLLATDGVYEVRTTRLGTFAARVPAKVEAKPGIALSTPKCPARLFLELVALFAFVPEVEVVAEIVYRPAVGDFALHPTRQRENKKGSVGYWPVEENQDLIPFLNAHSHNTMDAFFSCADDRAETRVGLYAVVGRVDRERPQASFRFSMGTFFGRVAPEEIFEDPHEIHERLEVI